MIEMAGPPPRPINAYVDERRRQPESRHQPDTRRENDRPRDGSGSFSGRNPPTGPARRESRDARDPRDDRDARDDRSRRQQNARPVTSPRRASSFTGPSSSTSTAEKPKPTRAGTDAQSPAKPPSRYVVPQVASKQTMKPPKIDNEEHQPLFSALWALTEITEERVSVKSKSSSWEATHGVREAYNTKVEKADEGTSGSLLHRTQMREQQKNDKAISEKVSESTERKKKAVERAIAQFAVLYENQSRTTKPAQEHSDSDRAIEKQIAELQSRFAKQQEQMAAQGQKLLSQDQKLSEQDRQYHQSQAQLQQMKEQQISAIKSIEALQKENEVLRQRFTKQMKEFSDGFSNELSSIKSGADSLKADVQRSDEHNRNLVHKMEAAHSQQVESTSQTQKENTLKMDAMDKTLKNHEEVQTRMKEDVKNLQSTSNELTTRMSTCEESTGAAMQKIEALDFESLDEMINQWFDKNVPEQIKRYAEICNELASIKQHIQESGAGTTLSVPATSSITEGLVDAKLGAQYQTFDNLVKDSVDALSEMVDEVSKDVATLKKRDLSTRVSALEAKSLADSAQPAADPMISHRLKTLEDQQLATKIQENQVTAIGRFDTLTAKIRDLEAATHHALRQELQPLVDKLEGVAMQANVLDNQFKNLSTKELGHLIIQEVQNVTGRVSDSARKASDDAKKAIDDTQKLNSRVETLQLGLFNIKNTQDAQKGELRELSTMVDIAVRTGAARIGEKRGSEGMVNGDHHDNKRQRVHGAGRGGA